MTPTAWALLALLVLAAVLVVVSLIAFRPGQDLARRPLPYPRSHRHRRAAAPLEVPTEAWLSGQDSMAWWHVPKS